MSILTKIAAMAHGAGALAESEIEGLEAEVRKIIREELVKLDLIEAEVRKIIREELVKLDLIEADKLPVNDEPSPPADAGGPVNDEPAKDPSLEGEAAKTEA